MREKIELKVRALAEEIGRAADASDAAGRGPDWEPRGALDPEMDATFRERSEEYDRIMSGLGHLAPIGAPFEWTQLWGEKPRRRTGRLIGVIIDRATGQGTGYVIQRDLKLVGMVLGGDPYRVVVPINPDGSFLGRPPLTDLRRC